MLRVPQIHPQAKLPMRGTTPLLPTPTSNAATVVTYHRHVRHAHNQPNHRESLPKNNKQVVYPDDGEKRDHEERDGHVGGLSVGTVPQPQASFALHHGHQPAVCGCPQWDSLFPQSCGRGPRHAGNTHYTRLPWRGSRAERHVQLEVMTERSGHRGIDDGVVDTSHVTTSSRKSKLSLTHLSRDRRKHRNGAVGQADKANVEHVQDIAAAEI